MFTHKPVQIPELETKTVDRKRFYLTPEGKMYPSITTVLQKSKMQGLMEWRKGLVMMLQIILQGLLHNVVLRFTICVKTLSITKR